MGPRPEAARIPALPAPCGVVVKHTELQTGPLQTHGQAHGSVAFNAVAVLCGPVAGSGTLRPAPGSCSAALCLRVSAHSGASDTRKPGARGLGVRLGFLSAQCFQGASASLMARFRPTVWLRRARIGHSAVDGRWLSPAFSPLGVNSPTACALPYWFSFSGRTPDVGSQGPGCTCVSPAKDLTACSPHGRLSLPGLSVSVFPHGGAGAPRSGSDAHPG